MTTNRRGRGVDRKGRSKKGGQFVPVPYPMAESAAWRSLTGAAVKVYVELRRRFNGGNNGKLSLSLMEAASLLRLSKSTVGRALDQLVERGFIVKTREGHWYGRKAAEYAVTDRPLDGHPPTNAWQNWRDKKTSVI